MVSYILTYSYDFIHFCDVLCKFIQFFVYGLNIVTAALEHDKNNQNQVPKFPMCQYDMFCDWI